MPYEFLQIPSSCAIGDPIYKKQFYTYSNLSTADKELFAKIKRIVWLYCFKPKTINIPPYKDEIRDYPEVEIIEVSLIEEANTRRLAEIIMRAIPYPMLLFFRLDQKIQVWTAHQRINLADGSKNTFEDFIHTDWLVPTAPLFTRLNVNKIRFTNYFTFYSDLVDIISIYNAQSKLEISEDLTGEEARQLTSQVEELEKKLASLRSALKKESQFNRKVDLNLKIKRFEKAKEELLQGGL